MTLILMFLLVAQGIPSLPGQTGTITGVLDSESGVPARGVRVAAMAAPDSNTAGEEGAVLVGLAQTDVAGWYRLEGIPPGRYFITAGRVDVPTFYPGTLDITKGTVVQITPGTMLTGIDFKVTEASVRSTNTVPTKQFNIPLQVTVEGGGKFVVSSPAPYLVLTRVADGRRTVISLDNSAIALPRPSSPVDYRVSVENLAGYTIKSLRFGTTDMLTNSIQLPSAAAVSSGATGTSIPIHLTLRQAPAQERR